MIRVTLLGAAASLTLLFIVQLIVESYDLSCHAKAREGRLDQLIAETVQADKEYRAYYEGLTK